MPAPAGRGALPGLLPAVLFSPDRVCQADPFAAQKIKAGAGIGRKGRQTETRLDPGNQLRTGVVIPVIHKNEGRLLLKAVDPVQQALLIRVAGNSAEQLDLRSAFDRFPHDFDGLCAVVDDAAEGADGLISDEENRVVFVP